MATNGNISHAEMWDDSALVDSWNDALQEYKKYHSIKALGEDADAVLRASEKINAISDTTIPKEGPAKGYGMNDQRAERAVDEKTADHDTLSGQNHSQSNVTRSTPEQTLNGPPALPHHLVGQVHDEGLKNLLMSWYYAGYYTGLYEGQKQEHVGTSAKHEA